MRSNWRFVSGVLGAFCVVAGVAFGAEGSEGERRYVVNRGATPFALPFDYKTANIPDAINTTREWVVRKTHWSQEDELGYAAFVYRIGASNCRSLDSCLKSEANPFRAEVDPYLPGDCADMAYVLRAYYAWKMALPFSYQSAMRTADGKRQDTRYSTGGNVVTSRRKIINSVQDAPSFLRRIGGEVSTAMFRTHPETGGGRSHDDFYPVKVDREYVRPGVIAYDIFGHVGLVYDITDDGRVLIVASHPDNSVSRSTYGRNFLRAGPSLGAGLKAWRPIRVDGANTQSDGALKGGSLVASENDAISGFSMEQYLGTKPAASGVWHEGEFIHAGRTMRYYDFVRRRLAAPGFEYNPVTELQNGMRDICTSIKARKTAVDAAMRARMHERPHPSKLPLNIYGTYGEWEEYSTPSRDARLKVSFIELRRTMQQLVQDVRMGAPGVRYDGADLAGELMQTYEAENDACQITYWRSDKSRMRLQFGHVMDRLFDLSFNPYLCPERRWGARGVELDTCTDNDVKSQWYAALRFLRYQADRTYDVRMDFALEELKPPMIAPVTEGGLGIDAPADADLRAYLHSLQEVVSTAAESDEVSRSETEL